MLWKIEFYSQNVADGINEWPDGLLAKFLLIAAVIEKFGPAELGMPHVRPLGHGLFEIRVKAKEGIGRAILCTVKGKVVIVLNEFIKKTQKTPPREIALARKRMAEVKSNE